MINKAFGIMIFVGLCMSTTKGQIVTIDPTFFTIDDEITVIFDASMGNQGLQGVSQVYAHTGIITSDGGVGTWLNVQGNWGTDDAKVKMKNIGDDKHSLTYKIRDFYDIGNSNVDVIQLAFVFRNVDGSKEGKTSTEGDIFIDLPEDGVFSAIFQSPDETFIVNDIGDEIDVSIVSSENASIMLFDNDVLIAGVEGQTKLEYTIESIVEGDHIVRFEAINNGDTVRSEFSYVVRSEVVVLPLPDNVILGWNILSSSDIVLVLHAPLKDFVHVIGDFSGWELKNAYSMNRTPDGENYWIRISDLDSTQIYGYQYLIDGELLIADPLSYLVIDPIHDGFVDLSSFPLLKDYNSEIINGVASVNTTLERDYSWQYDDVVMPEDEDLVIYEILLRDFLSDHSYSSLSDTLEYLKELGINAIELMPIQEFEGNNSWGYNPNYHGALDKYYGSADEFRDFVDAAHKLGIAIIIDVVYNHAFGSSPLVRMYWDETANRPSLDSPYFNSTAKHPFNVGYDFNHESNATKNYVKQTLSRWIEDFHIDGFRFDLSKGFTQRLSGENNEFSNYDASRIEILKDYADHVWSQKETAFVILEHFATNSEERELADYGMMLWGNGNFNFNEATMGYHDNGKSDFGHLAAVASRGWSSNRLIGYMESHDEERLMYKNLQFGNSSGSYSVKNLSVALDRVSMATAFFLAIPGPKMLWQFGELGYDNSINRCTDGTIQEDCRLSNKPIMWDYIGESDRRDLFEEVRGMVRLRNENTALKEGSYIADVSGAIKTIVRESNSEDVVLIGNFDVVSRNANINFSRTGMWYDFVNGDSIQIETLNWNTDLDPGAYHIYLSSRPDFTLDNENVLLKSASMSIAPNPSNGEIQISINTTLPTEGWIEIVDGMGRILYQESVIVNQGKFSVSMNLSDELDSGIYYARFFNRDGLLINKIIVQ